MIKIKSNNEILEELVSSIPSFSLHWKLYKENNKDWAEEIYLTLAEIVHYILEKQKNSLSDNELKDLFKKLDYLLVDSDEISKDYLAIGFIETLQNNLGDDKEKTQEIYNLLGKEAKSIWDGLLLSWQRFESQ